MVSSARTGGNNLVNAVTVLYTIENFYMLIRILFIAALFFSANAEAKIIDEHIYLVPSGNVEKNALENIKGRLPDYMPMRIKVEISPAEKLPQSAYDPARNQYNAEAVMRDIARRITMDKRNERIMIITDADLYSKDLDFVFGSADPDIGSCIISLARLKNEFYGNKPDEKIFYGRLLKEAAHELAHALGIKHCLSRKCVMYMSNTIQEMDKKGAKFCPECDNAVERHKN
jgi:archaemetzincin